MLSSYVLTSRLPHHFRWVDHLDVSELVIEALVIENLIPAFHPRFKNLDVSDQESEIFSKGVLFNKLVDTFVQMFVLVEVINVVWAVAY